MNSILAFFTVEHLWQIFLVFCTLMLLRWMHRLYVIFVEPTKLIYSTCHEEGSTCEVHDGHIYFRMEYDGRVFKGSNAINYHKVLSGEKSLLDYADVAYDQMHQALDRYLETKH